MALSEVELNEKIISYEQFLNETLKNDLKKVLDHRDGVYKEVAEYLALKNTIEAIDVSKLDGEPLKTKMDLGCNFYCQANVPNPSKIFIAIGQGIHLGMTHLEAVRFIEKKTRRLHDRSQSLTTDACKIKAHIRIVLEGLRELQGIDTGSKQEHRNIWDT